MADERLKININKKGFLVRTWVISTILFVTIFSLFYLASYEFADHYDSSSIIDSSYNDKYNKYDELIEQDDESFSDIFQGMTDGEGFDILDSIIGLPKVFLKAVKLSLSSVGTMSGIADDFSEDFGVPEEISNVFWGAIIIIISIVLIFGIISSVSRSNRI